MKPRDKVACPMFCVCRACGDKVAAEHWNADEACGRDWKTGGCQCAHCRSLRARVLDIDAGFARVTAAENRLREFRATRTTPPVSQP